MKSMQLLQQKNERPVDTLIQPALEIGKADDPQEREADAVADKVMRMTDGTEGSQRLMTDDSAGKLRLMSDGTEKLQMKCAGCEEEEKVQKKDSEEEEDKLQMKCDGCEEEEKVQKKSIIQKKGDGKMYASSEISQQLQNNKGTGEALPEQTQQDLGNKIGADFSNVKIHTDAKAVQLSKDLGAKAFTHGNDIYFNSGQYNPSSASGKHLLAHELTHTVQQGNNKIRQKKAQVQDTVIDPRCKQSIHDEVQKTFMNGLLKYTGQYDAYDKIKRDCRAKMGKWIYKTYTDKEGATYECCARFIRLNMWVQPEGVMPPGPMMTMPMFYGENLSSNPIADIGCVIEVASGIGKSTVSATLSLDLYDPEHCRPEEEPEEPPTVNPPNTIV